MYEWGTVPQWVSAVAAGIGVCIAGAASRSWKNTLRQKRRDDLLSCIYDFDGELGATKSAIGRKVAAAAYGARIDRLFASFRSVVKSYVVAKPSYGLDEDRLEGLRNLIQRTAENSRDLHEPTGAPIDARFDAARGQFDNLSTQTGEFLTYVRSKVN